MTNMKRRERRTFTKEFKHQMVQLYLSGKPANEITEEYDLSPTSIHTWVKQFNKTESFKASDNMTPEQVALIKKEKRIKEFEMENDILRQAALIIGRR